MEIGTWRIAAATAAAAVEVVEVSLGLYMDVHVPAGITRALRRRGVDVLTAQEDGTVRFLDPDLLDRASELALRVFRRLSQQS